MPRIPGALSVKQLHKLIARTQETGIDHTIYVAVVVRVDAPGLMPDHILVRRITERTKIVDDKTISYERKDGKGRHITISHARFFTNYWCLRSYILKYKGKEPVLEREYH